LADCLQGDSDKGDKKLIRVILLSVAALLQASLTVHAQIYPNKPIRVVVPYPAGGSGDIIGRAIGTKLTEAWGQSIIIDNRGGAGGSIAAELVARSPADGYTLLLGAGAQMVINPHIYKRLQYDPFKDFAPVIRVAYVEFVLAATLSITANTLPQLVTLLQSNSGRYSYASAGVGSIHHLSMEMLKRVAGGVNVVHVPYKGGSQFMPDLVSGEVQLAYVGISQAIPFLASGQLKATAIGSAQRLDALPGVPTIAETYPGFEANGDWDFYAPAGTPPDVVLKLNGTINDILKMPDVRELLITQGLYAIGGSPEQLAMRTKSDYDKWGAVIRDIGLIPE
jgi:tripartite-type tricarboxylate transporter receptor subunit TctC